MCAKFRTEQTNFKHIKLIFKFLFGCLKEVNFFSLFISRLTMIVESFNDLHHIPRLIRHVHNIIWINFHSPGSIASGGMCIEWWSIDSYLFYFICIYVSFFI